MATADATGAGVVLDLVRSGEATTRSDLIARLGWSRVTLARRLDDLLALGLIRVVGQRGSRGGRPPEEFAVSKDAGLLLAVDIGSSHTRVGVTDLVSNVLCEDEADIGLFDGPDEVFSWALQVFDFLLKGVGKSRTDVRGVGIGVPGPVDVTTGKLGSPQFDSRWDDVSVSDYLENSLPEVVVAVDRDVNILATGEARLAWPEHRDLVVVKAGIGVGCALVLDGQIYRGSRGGSGQLSAPARSRTVAPLQRLETVASGGAVRDALTQRGERIRTSSDIVALADRGDDDTVALLSEAGATIGYAVADVVGLLNPSVVIVGGDLAEAGERFIGPIRRAVFAASHAFSRQRLAVERSRLGTKAGVRGASLLVQDALFDVDRISQMAREVTGTG